MGVFGWSLPPRCGTLPGEEPGQAMELTDLVKRKPADVLDVWWDEEGVLSESFSYTVPADEYAGTPEYQEIDNAPVGVHEWNDNLSDDENRRAAAAAYDAIKEREVEKLPTVMRIANGIREYNPERVIALIAASAVGVVITLWLTNSL